MMSSSVDVTIAIVNYKTPDLLEKCLKSIYRYSRGFKFMIYVVDNASGDGSAQMVRAKFPKVKLIANRKNIYASRGFNQILRQVRSLYTLITEPGVQIFSNAIVPMLEFLKKHPKVGAVSCKQIEKNGQVDTTCSRFLTPVIELYNSSLIGRFFKNEKLISRFRYGSWKRDTTREVDVISDIFMLAKTKILSEVNFYDPQMDLFFMEYDLCLAVKRAGYSVWHLGNVTVRHIRGQSTLKFRPKDMYEIYERDMLYFYRKHFGFFWWVFLVLVFQSNRLYYFFARTK